MSTFLHFPPPSLSLSLSLIHSLSSSVALPLLSLPRLSPPIPLPLLSLSLSLPSFYAGSQVTMTGGFLASIS